MRRLSAPRALARPARDPQAGAAAVSAVLFLLVMAGFLALSLNAGLLMDTRTQLQAGSDAAALAAARSLDGTTGGLAAARTAAYRYSDEHAAYGERLIIDPMSDVIFGRWHQGSGNCIASGGTCVGFEAFSASFASTNPGRVTAVRVRNGRDGGSHNPVVQLPFGSFMGTPTAAVRSAATAIGPGVGTVNCALPIGVALCKIRPTQGSDALRCTTPLNFSNDQNDEVGFISFDGTAPNGNSAADFINSGMCGPSAFTLGDVRVQNGNDFGQVIDALRGVGHGNGQTGTGRCRIGTEQILPVIDAGCGENWGNPRFNRDSQIVGFVRVTIRAVTDNQARVLGCPGQPAPTLPPGTVPGRNGLVLETACDAEAGPPDAIGGGEVFNATDARVRLVE